METGPGKLEISSTASLPVFITGKKRITAENVEVLLYKQTGRYFTLQNVIEPLDIRKEYYHEVSLC
ncbi:MAG: hypothetical protein EA344_01330 [Alkalicoccus sp.]|nr:MAG: hypothetical protein EA344_01330 [Alkalicoccus sp.]